MRKINIIVAVDETGGFGKDGKIPWDEPEDLKHFQKVTKNSVCIMGRRTYEDIKEMQKVESDVILPNRDSYVVSSKLTDITDATIVKSLSEAIDESDQTKDVFVIGGYRMFVQALGIVSNVHMTVIPGDFDCDVRFPIGPLCKGFDIESGVQEGDLKYMIYKRVRKFR